MSVSEEEGELEPSYIAGRRSNGAATSEKSGGSSQGYTELPRDPTIPLPGTCHTDTCAQSSSTLTANRYNSNVPHPINGGMKLARAIH